MDKKDDQNSSKNNELSPFKDNASLSFIHKKAEKISCAIYLLTNHLSEQEPLKWNIRGLTLEFIKDIFFLKDYFADNFIVLENLKNKILEIISLTDLLMNAGFISDMNYRILRSEIIKLSELLGPERDFINSPESIFEDGFFDVSGSLPPPISPRFMGILPDIEFDNGPKETSFGREKDIPSEHKGHDKGHMSFRNMSFKKGSKTLDKNISQGSSSERRQEIITFIKDKKEVTIKDVTSLIKDCSEKTLQRDLVALVKAGVLKKEGERRWSKYLLA